MDPCTVKLWYSVARRRVLFPADGCLSLSGCNYKQQGWFMTKWTKKKQNNSWIVANIMVDFLFFLQLAPAARSPILYNITLYKETHCSRFSFFHPPDFFQFSPLHVSLIPLFSFAHTEECYPLVAGRRATWRPERRKSGGRRETQRGTLRRTNILYISI